jgi:hypothetical protein
MERNEEVTNTETGETYVVKLTKPFMFEGQEYDSVDLSGLDKLTIQDAIEVQGQLLSEAASTLLCETTTAFAMAIASRATGKPIEFFKMMPMGAGRQVRRQVQKYLRQEGGQSGTVLKLQKPYTYQGETYQQFDLSPIGEMSTLQEMAAENAVARAGFVITENSFNYLYACVIAAMAVGQPKELFTGLPLKELVGLKNTVNNTDFFE